MPVVTIRWLEGRTREQRKELVKGITDLFVGVAKVKPEDMHIVFMDVPRGHWAKGYRFYDEP